mmetsp:Transcript_151742/g.385791  ORF Transcript_151742/g.385791 Transcript_151742/m.385791 type:complete len:134 (+) Transcript_151742:550-951(+)
MLLPLLAVRAWRPFLQTRALSVILTRSRFATGVRKKWRRTWTSSPCTRLCARAVGLAAEDGAAVCRVVQACFQAMITDTSIGFPRFECLSLALQSRIQAMLEDAAIIAPAPSEASSLEDGDWFSILERSAGMI